LVSGVLIKVMIKKRITLVYGSCLGGKEESLPLGRDGSPSRLRAGMVRWLRGIASHARGALAERALPPRNWIMPFLCFLAVSLAHAAPIHLMGEMARALEKDDEDTAFESVARDQTFQQTFFDFEERLYRAGDRWVVDREVKGTVIFEVRKK
jgi:hypothetical protein